MPRVGEIVATARAERRQMPVPLDELHEGGMLGVAVLDVAAAREKRDGDHRDTRARAEEVDRLDEARIIVAAAFVHGDENRRLRPLLLVALGERDDVRGEGLEKAELRGVGVAVYGA